jgi:hypothetical protein
LLGVARELGIEVPASATASADAGSPASGAQPAPPDGPAERPAAASKPPRQRRRRTASTGAGSDPQLDARVVDALRANPGTTITELATILGIPVTSLYRPVRELTNSGTLIKRGRGLHAAA